MYIVREIVDIHLKTSPNPNNDLKRELRAYQSQSTEKTFLWKFYIRKKKIPARVSEAI